MLFNSSMTGVISRVGISYSLEGYDTSLVYMGFVLLTL